MKITPIKNIFFVILLLTLTYNSHAQSQETKDKVVKLICEDLINYPDATDSMKVEYAFSKYLYPYLANFPKSEMEEAFNGIYFRMQRECQTFKEIVNNLSPPKHGWAVVYEIPKIKEKRKTCRAFLEKEDYYYLESNGDTVNVLIQDGLWTDQFSDGSFSQLNFKWIDDCSFKLEFIKSDNDTRKNFSKAGDIYIYHLFKENKGVFKTCAEVPGQSIYYTFNLYKK